MAQQQQENTTPPHPQPQVTAQDPFGHEEDHLFPDQDEADFLEMPQDEEIQNEDEAEVGQDEAQQNQQEVPQPTRRSRRTHKPTQALLDMFSQRDLAFPIMFEALAEINAWESEQQMDNPLAFLGKTGDPDTMYLHEAMQQPD